MTFVPGDIRASLRSTTIIYGWNFESFQNNKSKTTSIFRGVFWLAKKIHGYNNFKLEGETDIHDNSNTKGQSLFKFNDTSKNVKKSVTGIQF